MTLRGTVTKATPGVLGFDSSEALNAVQAKQYFNKGYRFCVRYVPHSSSGGGSFVDLSQTEGQGILDAGLALMVVQHPPASGWEPTATLGKTFGAIAAAKSGAAGVPPGTNIFLDLEGVKPGVAASDVISFCNSWFFEVESVGYETGVYVGASPILTADQLYWDLKTTHYWKGGSSAKAGVPDDIPNRGYQLVQRIFNAGKRNEFDSDVTHTDHFGGAVMWVTSLLLS